MSFFVGSQGGNMTRKLFQIVIVLLGLISTSLATLTGTIVPTRVEYVTNQDVKIDLLNVSGNAVSTLSMPNKSVLPLHYDNVFYFSPTLSMDDLSTDNSNKQLSDNKIVVTQNMKLDKETDNAYLEVEFVVKGNDAINESLRCLIVRGTEKHLLKPNERILTDIKLTTSPIPVEFDVFYELDSESTTIENINNAEGADITLNLYVNVKE